MDACSNTGVLFPSVQVFWVSFATRNTWMLQGRKTEVIYCNRETCVLSLFLWGVVLMRIFSTSETHKATSEFKASLDNPSQESRSQARHKSPWVTPRYRFYIWISQTLGLRNICLDILESWDVEPSRNHHSSIQRLAALDAAPLGLRLTIVILTWQGGARIGLGLGLSLCLFLGH